MEPSYGAPEQRLPFERTYFPFPRTASERLKTGDPRMSIAERYLGQADYMTRYTKALDDLAKQRWILPEDRSSMLRRGEQEWAEATK